MSLFVVDQEKCKRDGVCVAECPMGIIELKGGNSTLTPTGDAEELCINFGLCVAVCPHGAFSLRKMKPSQCRGFQKGRQQE